MRARQNARNAQLRECLAQEAARLMIESGIRDFGLAKRKAAQRLRVVDARQLPRNDEIERAMQEYQRLFRADRQPHHLRELRRVALRAMRFLDRFEPRLVGPVLRGTADQYSEVTLHLFTDTAEEVHLFLSDHRIPYQLGEKRLRISTEELRVYPTCRLVAEGVPVELIVFPYNGRRQPPLSPVDGRPMRRMSLAKLEALGDEVE